MPSVSIIIVNFNAGDNLFACVDAILQATDTAEIIVVDNASRDNSLERLVSAHGNLKQLHIIRNTANLGFARACNIGTQQASGEFLLYLNPDCIINDGTIPALTVALQKHSDAGMAGGRLMNPDGTEQPGGRRGLPTPWRAFVRLSGLYRLNTCFPGLFPDFLLHQERLPDDTTVVEAVSGACMMVPRRTIETVGGFDEGYFLHVEDLDWCMRIRQKGWKVLFAPEARVIHFKGVCSSDRPVFVEWHKHRGFMRFYRKLFGQRHLGVWIPLLATGVWCHFLLVTARSLLKSGLARN